MHSIFDAFKVIPKFFVCFPELLDFFVSIYQQILLRFQGRLQVSDIGLQGLQLGLVVFESFREFDVKLLPKNLVLSLGGQASFPQGLELLVTSEGQLLIVVEPVSLLHDGLRQLAFAGLLNLGLVVALEVADLPLISEQWIVFDLVFF